MNTVDLSIKRFLLPPMNREGQRFVLTAALLTFLMTLLWTPLAIPGLMLTAGVYLFFRDPERVPPDDPQAVVSPADGIVCMLTQTAVPGELEAGDTPVWRVSIFMSMLNVHVNRLPVSGTVIRKRYIPGKFFNASLDKASTDNERYLYLIKTGTGYQLGVVQIAGLIARRIVCFVKEGQKLTQGERFGLIRFGSRLDVYLPPGTEPVVKAGQIMTAGETVIART
ncbi:MAG: phosphatidylserine decarboxylase [Kiritimatiellia bacterium]